MASDASGWEPAQLRALRAELGRNPALVDAILSRPDLFPPVPAEPERVIRASQQNSEQAVCRAVALAAVRRQVWAVNTVE
jgi:hypothetical protein